MKFPFEKVVKGFAAEKKLFTVVVSGGRGHHEVVGARRIVSHAAHAPVALVGKRAPVGGAAPLVELRFAILSAFFVSMACVRRNWSVEW